MHSKNNERLKFDYNQNQLLEEPLQETISYPDLNQQTNFCKYLPLSAAIKQKLGVASSKIKFTGINSRVEEQDSFLEDSFQVTDQHICENNFTNQDQSQHSNFEIQSNSFDPVKESSSNQVQKQSCKNQKSLSLYEPKCIKLNLSSKHQNPFLEDNTEAMLSNQDQQLLKVKIKIQNGCSQELQRSRSFINGQTQQCMEGPVIKKQYKNSNLNPFLLCSKSTQSLKQNPKIKFADPIYLQNQQHSLIQFKKKRVSSLLPQSNKMEREILKIFKRNSDQLSSKFRNDYLYQSAKILDQNQNDATNLQKNNWKTIFQLSNEKQRELEKANEQKQLLTTHFESPLKPNQVQRDSSLVKGAKGQSLGCDSYRISQLNPMDSPDLKKIRFNAQKNKIENNSKQQSILQDRPSNNNGLPSLNFVQELKEQQASHLLSQIRSRQDIQNINTQTKADITPGLSSRQNFRMSSSSGTRPGSGMYQSLDRFNFYQFYKLVSKNQEEDEVIGLRKTLREDRAEFIKKQALLEQRVDQLTTQLIWASERERNLKKNWKTSLDALKKKKKDPSHSDSPNPSSEISCRKQNQQNIQTDSNSKARNISPSKIQISQQQEFDKIIKQLEKENSELKINIEKLENLTQSQNQQMKVQDDLLIQKEEDLVQMRNFKLEYENQLKISSEQKIGQLEKYEAMEVNLLQKQIQNLENQKSNQIERQIQNLQDEFRNQERRLNDQIIEYQDNIKNTNKELEHERKMTQTKEIRIQELEKTIRLRENEIINNQMEYSKNQIEKDDKILLVKQEFDKVVRQLLNLKNRAIQIKEQNNSSFNEILDLLFFEDSSDSSFKSQNLKFRNKLDQIPIVHLGLEMKKQDKALVQRKKNPKEKQSYKSLLKDADQQKQKEIVFITENKRYKNGKNMGDDLPERSRSKSTDAKGKDAKFHSINLKSVKQIDESNTKSKNLIQGRIIKISDWSWEDKFDDDGSFTPEITNALRRKVADLRSQLTKLRVAYNDLKSQSTNEIKKLKNLLLLEKKKIEEITEEKYDKSSALMKDLIERDKRIHKLHNNLLDLRSEKDELLSISQQYFVAPSPTDHFQLKKNRALSKGNVYQSQQLYNKVDIPKNDSRGGIPKTSRFSQRGSSTYNKCNLISNNSSFRSINSSMKQLPQTYGNFNSELLYLARKDSAGSAKNLKEQSYNHFSQSNQLINANINATRQIDHPNMRLKNIFGEEISQTDLENYKKIGNCIVIDSKINNKSSNSKIIQGQNEIQNANQIIFNNQNSYLNINKRLNISPLKAMSIRDLEVQVQQCRNSSNIKNKQSVVCRTPKAEIESSPSHAITFCKPLHHQSGSFIQKSHLAQSKHLTMKSLETQAQMEKKLQTQFSLSMRNAGNGPVKGNFEQNKIYLTNYNITSKIKRAPYANNNNVILDVSEIASGCTGSQIMNGCQLIDNRDKDQRFENLLNNPILETQNRSYQTHQMISSIQDNSYPQLKSGSMEDTEKANCTDKTERDRYNMLSSSLFVTENNDLKDHSVQDQNIKELRITVLEAHLQNNGGQQSKRIGDLKKTVIEAFSPQSMQTQIIGSYSTSKNSPLDVEFGNQTVQQQAQHLYIKSKQNKDNSQQRIEISKVKNMFNLPILEKNQKHIESEDECNFDEQEIGQESTVNPQGNISICKVNNSNMAPLKINNSQNFQEDLYQYQLGYNTCRQQNKVETSEPSQSYKIQKALMSPTMKSHSIKNLQISNSFQYSSKPFNPSQDKNTQAQGEQKQELNFAYKFIDKVNSVYKQYQQQSDGTQQILQQNSNQNNNQYGSNMNYSTRSNQNESIIQSRNNLNQTLSSVGVLAQRPMYTMRSNAKDYEEQAKLHENQYQTNNDDNNDLQQTQDAYSRHAITTNKKNLSLSNIIINSIQNSGNSSVNVQSGIANANNNESEHHFQEIENNNVNRKLNLQSVNSEAYYNESQQKKPNSVRQIKLDIGKVSLGSISQYKKKHKPVLPQSKTSANHIKQNSQQQEQEFQHQGSPSKYTASSKKSGNEKSQPQILNISSRRQSNLSKNSDSIQTGSGQISNNNTLKKGKIEGAQIAQQMYSAFKQKLTTKK